MSVRATKDPLLKTGRSEGENLEELEYTSRPGHGVGTGRMVPRPGGRVPGILSRLWS